eukprot:11155288-Lingulodinium_polyedra.AAC.1
MTPSRAAGKPQLATETKTAGVGEQWHRPEQTHAEKRPVEHDRPSAAWRGIRWQYLPFPNGPPGPAGRGLAKRP